MKYRISMASLCVASMLFLSTPSWSADIVFLTFDPPGVGFNDNTPVPPSEIGIGGNPGTTVGEQRRFVYEYATNLWGQSLESDVTIFVLGQFAPQPCSPTGGVLGSAGPTRVYADVDGGIFPKGFTWYTNALADALAGFDLSPGIFDIVSTFNSSIDDDPQCLTGATWYYGIDHNNPVEDIDFLSVVTHEINHGLGFLELISESTGEVFFGLPDIYSTFMFDLTIGKKWDEMTDAERLFSTSNTDNLVWYGDQVSAEAATYLGPKPALIIDDPDELEGKYEAQPASFGPPIGTGDDDDDDYEVRLVNDGQDTLANGNPGSVTDACESIPRRKARKLRGKYALIDRGGCAFTVKVANVQAAGAKGAIVANNQPTGRAPMGGSDPNITIPSVGISMALGDAIKAALNGDDDDVEVSFGFNRRELAGTSQGLVRLYAPAVITPGSSKSHWDTSASPNLLMEPAINDDLTPGQDLDLSPALLHDIGWTLLNPPRNPPDLGGPGGEDDDSDDD
ncbi:MAG: hypothetical protein QNJ07_02820 [Woeseiaceae bacterium]|nr:hypothetical protein [Woeseiaceae bacterium]